MATARTLTSNLCSQRHHRPTILDLELKMETCTHLVFLPTKQSVVWKQKFCLVSSNYSFHVVFASRNGQPVLPRGCSLKKILVHSQKKSEKSEKSKDFFEDLKFVLIQCLNPFSFIKSSYTKNKIRKIQKIQEKSKKDQKDFVEDLKSVHLIWE